MGSKAVQLALLTFVIPAIVLAQEQSTSPPHLDEVVVTATKWEQSANSVAMPITAATSHTLQIRGINSVADLTRLVPGLTIQESSFNSTSFTLRGVGFFNSDLATPPAVTVYVDEAPLPYPAMTKLAAFDLSRVEVLKGPQGTLYGQNATGGAVNYIAAQPTDSDESGMDVIYGTFNRLQVSGFASGPITDQLKTRVAVQGRRGDAWQKSISRPADRLGAVRELQGRATLEWLPHDRVSSRLALTLTHDASESVATQFIAPALTLPDLAAPGLVTFPVTTRSRAADWTPQRSDNNAAFPYENDTTLYQGTLRTDYRSEADITFTSLTSYSDFRMAYGQDGDGTPLHINEVIDDGGKVSSFFQELRAAGRGQRLQWLIGANYTKDHVHDDVLNFVRDLDVCSLFEAVDPEAYCDQTLYSSDMHAETYGVFGRIEHTIADPLTFEAAVRYNEDRRTFENCSTAVSDHFARYWNIFRGGAQPATEVGDCFILDPANGFHPVDTIRNRLDQDSVSWRAGLNWTLRPEVLLYANVSKGFKAGTSPLVGASTVAQFTPVPQESVLAYEAGAKSALFARRLQLNASAFYYDYKDKQLRGAVLDSTFGPLEALVSIPRSHVIGAEAQLVARPFEAFTFDTAVTYVKTQIDLFTGFDAVARFDDQSGTPFPFSPQWQSVTNIDYTYPLSRALNVFAGGSLIHNSKTYAGVGAVDVLQIDAFTLLDLRAGVEAADKRYRMWLWGKNVTDEYYWINAVQYGNAISRYVGQPASYGLSFSARL